LAATAVEIRSSPRSVALQQSGLPARVSAYLSRIVIGWGPMVLALGVILGLWALLTTTGIVKFYVLPTPGAVISAFHDNFGLLWRSSLITAGEASLGFALGTAIAIVMAILFVYVPSFERSWYPLILLSQGVPFVALIPIFLLLFGVGREPKIAIAAFVCIAPTLLNVRRGLRSADAEVSELLYTYSAGGVQRLTKVRIPSALPFLFASFQVTVGRAFVTAIVAEWISSTAGIGWLVQSYSSQFEIPQLWAAIFAAILTCLAAFGTVRLIEYYATRWRHVGVSGV
jgi:NitT/TauT family transport system permease protein